MSKYNTTQGERERDSDDGLLSERPCMSKYDLIDGEREREIINVVFPRRLLKEFIALYKEHPQLWNRDCPAYKHKQKRHEAITKLTELVQQHDPNATRVHVLRKIESLRACVRREAKRVRDSRMRATNLDEVYKPQLWYFDLFSFIFTKDVYSEFQVKGESGRSAESDDDHHDEEETAFDQSLDAYPDYGLATTMVEVSDSKHYSGFEEDLNKSKRQCIEVVDEYDAIGVNVAAKLRSLQANQRILAEKLINDVLYQAQLNGLHSSTVIKTSDPIKHDPL